MQLNNEAIALISFFIAIATSVWRMASRLSAMRADLREAIARIDFDRQLNDERLQCLQDRQSAELHTLEEKFGIFSSRSREESATLGIRVSEIERHLIKTSNF